jgi:hypothetical protein
VKANRDKNPVPILDGMISNQEKTDFGVLNIGPFSSIGFYPFAVMTGLVTSEVGKRNSFFGRISKDKRYGELDGMGCNNHAKRQSLLKALSQRRSEKLCHTENALCEVYRKYSKYDLFFYGQSLYDIVDRGSGSDGVVVVEKKFGEKEWAKVTFDAPICPASPVAAFP